MRMARLGATGPEISVIGFGAWEAGGDAWGPNGPEDAVIGSMRVALETGMTWIDTAEVYGKGTSETLVGKAVAGRRDEVLIATKVAPEPEGTGFRPEQIRAACDRSLSRMGIEPIDLYQLHWPDEGGVPLEDSWGAMADLEQAGKIRFLGVSNFTRELIERCEQIRHVDSLQQELSMLALDDRELIGWCHEVGTGVLAYGPLGFGLLTGALSRAQVDGLDDWRTRGADAPFTPETLNRAEAIIDGMRPVAEELETSLAQLALAWNVRQPGVTAAIAGSRNPDHVRANAAAGDLELDAETLAVLESVVAVSD